MPKISICILAHNCADTIAETIESCLWQNYQNKEICIMENGSTDNTLEVCRKYPVTIHSIKDNIGFSRNIERCFDLPEDYIVLMCADDVFTDRNVVSDIMREFKDPGVCHVSRYYYQFIDGKGCAVRVNHSDNIYLLADNPSGLAFRNIGKAKASNEYFIETVGLVKNIIDTGKKYSILKYDTVSVRIHNNFSKNNECYKESIIKNWYKLTQDKELILSLSPCLIQIKCYGSYLSLFREIKTFISINKKCLISPGFWFYVTISALIPRSALIYLKDFYKDKILKKFIRRIKRNENQYLYSLL